MIPIRQALDAVRAVHASTELRYVHPSLFIICTETDFLGRDQEQRIADFLGKIVENSAFSEAELQGALDAVGAVLYLMTPDERASELGFLEKLPEAHHWLEFLWGNSKKTLAAPAKPPAIHFYGFKGGQARSTVLATLAKSLANDGYSVLAIDADIEAPSLHKQFAAKIVRLESTLLGCVQYGLSSIPQPVYIPIRTGKGKIDLIACKPGGKDFDLDLAAFTLHSALNPVLLQSGVRDLLANSETYDFILIDHRSGLAPSVLPLVAAFPGPVIVFARLDEQSDDAEAYFGALFSQNPEMPGLYVSFSLDPDDTEEKLRSRGNGRINSLLDILADGIRLGALEPDDDEPELEVAAEDLGRYWVSWFHDRSFLMPTNPAFETISADNRASIGRIRELIRAESRKALVAPQADENVPARSIGLTSSGNTDQGILIETEALRKLTLANTPYTYILGRKGTGKTRIVRELVKRGSGKPLLAADDYEGSDCFKSSDAILRDISGCLPPQDADKLWWVLLDAVSEFDTRHPKDVLGDWLKIIQASGPSAVSVSALTKRLMSNSTPKVYLIDGVETAFNSSQMAQFVEGLFKFLGSVQSNRELLDRITIRLFIRTDLVRLAVENIEQQIEGRYLTLLWNTQSILNFALSRIGGLDWFKNEFPTATKDIDAQWVKLEQGALSETECNEILLKVFPEKLRRNNLLTLTFLKDYFSEGEGESASYYPRIYDSFLRAIADPTKMSTRVSFNQIADGRVAQPLILAAHDWASKEYLNQVAAELRNLVSLSDDSSENAQRVQPLLSAFTGLSTPFDLDDCIEKLHEKLKDSFSIDRDRIRIALQQMKRIGIFEDRPGYPGWWRVGRLFKTALGMKYVRSATK